MNMNMNQIVIHFLKYPFSYSHKYLHQTITIILFETLLWRVIDIDGIYLFMFSLAIAIYLEANKDHLKSFQLIFNRYSILSPVLGICLAFASIFYILYGYWISFVIAISGLIYTSMFSIPRMISPLNIWVLLIRVFCLSLYLYIFPLMLKEVAYILSLFMPSLMLQLSYLIGYYIFLASTICMLDIQEKMINTVTLLQVLQVSRLRTKEHGIYEYIINFIDKVKTSDIQTPPSCQCQNSVNNLNNGWCESCGIGMVPGVILPLWTSGNSEINKIIFNTQLESKHMFDHIEWINHDGFRDIKEIKKGRFGCIYSAIWIDGPMPLFGMARNGAQNVIIKSLGRTPSDVTPEFILELKEYVKLVTSYTELRYELLGTIQCYGLTQDSTTKEYMLVMENIKKGNLRNYLNQNFKNMKWIDEKLKILISIAKGLKLIHQSGFIHKNLHSGNILIGEDGMAYISDFGLTSLITNRNSKKEITSKGIYGVLPFVAPEVLKRIRLHTKESNIYSFGIIMWSLSSGKPPFYGNPLTTSLALEICSGERPEVITQGTPKCYIDLMKRCWDSDPAERPNINEIYEILIDWYFLIKNYDDFKIADNEMNDKEFGRNPRVVEDEDVYYSQFIDLDAISKEEAFEVLDEEQIISD